MQVGGQFYLCLDMCCFCFCTQLAVYVTLFLCFTCETVAWKQFCVGVIYLTATMFSTQFVSRKGHFALKDSELS